MQKSQEALQMSKMKCNSTTCQLNRMPAILTAGPFSAVPFKQGVGSAQDPVDDVEIPALEAIHHLCQQVWPLLGEVLPPNDTDGITQLQRKQNCPRQNSTQQPCQGCKLPRKSCSRLSNSKITTLNIYCFPHKCKNLTLNSHSLTF